MSDMELFEILERVHKNQLSVEGAAAVLKDMPQLVGNYASLDRNRQLRTGIPEVIFAEGKTADQIVGIMAKMMEVDSVVMATRVSSEKATVVCESLENVKFKQDARMLIANEQYIPQGVGRGDIMVISAGTSDITVAEEAYITLKCLGHSVQKKYDVGVAGIHRLLSCLADLNSATVVIVVAGMEGALPSVVAGLISSPVIAVPTSVGYGAGAGGIAALLGMLNSCSPGVAVVNIDNGFGAGCMAAAINQKKI